MKAETKGEWTLSSNDLQLYILKLEDPIEGTETIWVSKEQLESLKVFLNTRDAAVN